MVVCSAAGASHQSPWTLGIAQESLELVSDHWRYRLADDEPRDGQCAARHQAKELQGLQGHPRYRGHRGTLRDITLALVNAPIHSRPSGSVKWALEYLRGEHVYLCAILGRPELSARTCE